MKTVVYGLNHKTAPLSVREKVAFLPHNVQTPLRSVVRESAASEAVVLSTCNRTEIYCYAELDSSHTIAAWLHDYHGLAPNELTPHLYCYQGEQALTHLLKVACGIDSMLIGEPQILGQVKAAYQTAHEHGTVGSEFKRLFQTVFSVAKKVRSETAIGANPVSVPYAAMQLAKKQLNRFAGKNVLLIGSGDIIELTARYLAKEQCGQIIIANRSLENAMRLASQYGALSCDITDIAHYIKHADVVISATACPIAVISPTMVQQAMVSRPGQPLLMFDLAVPRDVDYHVGDMENVTLYTIDDLTDIVNGNQQEREKAASEANALIAEHVSHYAKWIKSLNVVSTIRAYRGQAQDICDAEMQKALQRLEKGEPAEVVTRQFAQQLTNKLLHGPTTRLSQASYHGHAAVVEAAQTLFDVEQ